MRALVRVSVGVSAVLSSFVLLAFFFLTSSFTIAEEAAIDNVALTIPVACSFSPNTAPGVHTATINPGTYESEIDYTDFTVFCNDGNGFALYAIGYSNEEYGNTTLIGQGTGQTIATGTATSGDTSNWAMKMVKVTDGSYQPNNLTLTNGFGGYHAVPSTYTKVAEYASSTDTTLGSKLQSTYAAFIASTQMADTYAGKVKYTLVHPANAPAPVPVSKNLYYAITGSANNYTLTISDSDITAGAVASGPVAIDGYTFDEDEGVPTTPWFSYFDQITSVVVSGTVAPTSTAYWFYGLENCDSWNLNGLKTGNVTDMSYMFAFAGFNASSFTLDLSSWNTSKVTDMSYMFISTGDIATTWSVGDLSNWDTSNVTNMSNMFHAVGGGGATTFSLDLSDWDTANVTDMSSMFENAGYNATTWSVGDLSDWYTANVTDMSSMFSNAGYNATTFTLDLSGWNTTSVTTMNSMFSYAGRNATTWSVGDLSGWNTASVTAMNNMFSSAGRSATTWSVGDLSDWNTASATSMNQMFSSAGRSATTWSVGDLSGWNTASVTNMNNMFYYAGYSATSWSIGDLSGWNTASVTNMNNMFSYAGYNATTFTLDLSGWNTASVTNMQSMFSRAGYNATTFTLDLSGWNTASVTNMSTMFSNAGYSATTWSVTIPKTNGAATPIDNTTARLYGKSTSTYAAPASGKSFTLAN